MPLADRPVWFALSVIGGTSGGRSNLSLGLRQFVMPAELRVPVFEPNIRRQVIRMAKGPLYRADATSRAPPGAVQQPHPRAYTGLARLHKNHFLVAEAVGPVPLTDPAAS